MPDPFLRARAALHSSHAQRDSALFRQRGRETRQARGSARCGRGLHAGYTCQELAHDYKNEMFMHCRVAINEEFAPDDQELKEGDVVALIPPVSGG